MRNGSLRMWCLPFALNVMLNLYTIIIQDTAIWWSQILATEYCYVWSWVACKQFAISAFPTIHFVGVFRVPQRTQTVLHKNCLHVLLGLSIVFASTYVCWGATNTQTKCTMGNVQMTNFCPSRWLCVVFGQRECQKLSFLNFPAEFGMFVSLRNDLYSQRGIFQLNNGFNS